MKSSVVLYVLILQVCSSFGQVTLEQILPEGDLCLGDMVMYSCFVEASHQLVWRYVVNGTTLESHPFVFDDPVTSEVVDLGPFELLYVSSDPVSGFGGNIMSTATVANGLTADEEGVTIECAGTETLEITISFAAPDISNISFCINTIIWSPPSCDSNCTVSVDGQEIDTVPCKNGKLQTSHSDLSNEVVMIISIDSLRNIRNTSTVLISEDCSEFPIDVSTTAVKSTESPSASARGGLSAGAIVGIVFVIIILAAALAIIAAVLLIFFHMHSRKINDTTTPVTYQTQDDPDKHKSFVMDYQETFTYCHAHPITYCAISPDAQYFGTADSEMVVRAWKIQPGYNKISDLGTFDDFLIRAKNKHKDRNSTEESTNGKNKKLKNDKNKKKSKDDKKESKLPDLLKKKKLLLSLDWVIHDKDLKLMLTYDNCVIIWDVENDDVCTLYEPQKLKKYAPSMLCTACSRSDSMVALSFTSDLQNDLPLGQLLVGNIDEIMTEKRKLLCEQEAYVLSMSFSLSGKRLVIGNINGSIRLYTNVSDLSNSKYFEWTAHQGKVYDVQFGSADEEKVYSLGEDQMFYLWDTSTTSAPLRKIKFQDYQHPPKLFCIEKNFMGSDTVISHPAISRSKLFGCSFGYECTMISSVEGKTLYKVDSDFILTQVDTLLSRGQTCTSTCIRVPLSEVPISCLDCVHVTNSDFTTCVMGLTNTSVKVVRLEYTYENEEDPKEPITQYSSAQKEQQTVAATIKSFEGAHDKSPILPAVDESSHTGS